MGQENYSMKASDLGGPISVSNPSIQAEGDTFANAANDTALSNSGNQTPNVSVQSGRQLALDAARNGTPITTPQGQPVVPQGAVSPSVPTMRLNSAYKPATDAPSQIIRQDSTIQTSPGDKNAPTVMVRTTGLGADQTPTEVQVRANYTTSDPNVSGRAMVGANLTNNTLNAGASVDINPQGQNRGELNGSVAVSVSHNLQTPPPTLSQPQNPTTLSGNAMVGVGPVGVYGSVRSNDLGGDGSNVTTAEAGVRVATDGGPMRTATLAPRGAQVFVQSNDRTSVSVKTGAETNTSDPRVGARLTDVTLANTGDGKIAIDAEISAGQNDMQVSGGVYYRANDGNFYAGVEARYKNNYNPALPDETSALATIGINFGGPPSGGGRTNPPPQPSPVAPAPVAEQPPPTDATPSNPDGGTPGMLMDTPPPLDPNQGYPRVADLDTGGISSEISSYTPPPSTTKPTPPSPENANPAPVSRFEAPGVTGLQPDSVNIVPAY